MPTITKDKIEFLLKNLAKKARIIDARKNNLPAKQYFFPPEEKIFVFEKRKISLANKIEPFIIFGLNLRDTEALVQLDEIMKKPKPDFFYWQKRSAATIISIIEEDGSLPHVGIDLILEKMNEKEYKATALTDKGKKIIKSKLFHSAKPTYDVGSKTNALSPMPKLRKLLKDPELLKDAVEWSWKGYPEIWERLGQQCLGCGICSYICPLCHCFSNEDSCGLSDGKCAKTRRWTACTLPEFSKITGGHNFHPTLKERYYNWFFHKFVRAYKEFGKSQCVACGRCQQQCPAGIDIEKIMLEILETYKKAVS